MIKLLHITTVPESLEFFTGQIGYMKEKGFDIHALSSPGAPLAKFAGCENIPVYAIDMPRRITPLKDLRAVFRIWRRLRLVRPHIVHAHTPKGGLLGMIAAWLSRVPVRIYHIRGLPFTAANGYKRPLLQLTEKVSCLLAHQVLCVSYSVRDVAIAKSLCPASKIKVLHNGSGNGVDALKRFNPIRMEKCYRFSTRSSYGIPDDACVIGFVGRIVRDKGFVELASAWSMLREQYPALHLLVAGRFEPQDPVPSEIRYILGQDQRCHFAGRVEDIAPLYKAMDILVLPTYREGFPNVALEGAAMELAIVATRVPGCIDATNENKTGLLVRPRDSNALADAIRIYITNPGLRRQHGRAGRKRVLCDFQQKEVWNALYQQYSYLLTKEGLPVPIPIEDSTTMTTTSQLGATMA